nr:MAG TPA: hypothetical protein [Bacteriophage sp.]
MISIYKTEKSIYTMRSEYNLFMDIYSKNYT